MDAGPRAEEGYRSHRGRSAAVEWLLMQIAFIWSSSSGLELPGWHAAEIGSGDLRSALRRVCGCKRCLRAR